MIIIVTVTVVISVLQEMYTISRNVLLTSDKVTLKKLPKPLVGVIFEWGQVNISSTELFNYVVQCIDGPTVSIYQQSRVVNLVTQAAKPWAT